jgi:fatty acid CoA ligase FadD9
VEHALRALPEHQRRQSVLSTLDAYRLPLPPQPGSSLPMAATAEVLDTHCPGGVPHLSRELVAKTLADLRSLGHLSD